MSASFSKWVQTAAFAVCAFVAGVGAAQAVDVTIDQSTLTLGYMNVSDLPSNGGAFQFGVPGVLQT